MLFDSGYAKDIIFTSDLDGMDAAFIQKPYKREDILGKLSQVKKS